MNSRKGDRPKIYPEVTPLPTEVPVGESKLWFVRSNVNDFYAFIWLKLRIISYPECFRLFFRLGRASGAKTELQIDLTSSVLHQSPLRKNWIVLLQFPVSPSPLEFLGGPWVVQRLMNSFWKHCGTVLSRSAWPTSLSYERQKQRLRLAQLYQEW